MMINDHIRDMHTRTSVFDLLSMEDHLPSQELDNI